MPFIPEEQIDRIEGIADDLRDAVRTQTQALLVLDSRINVAVELLTKIHEAVTKPAEGDGLGELLEALIAADKQHASVLQKVLAAVERR